MKLYELCHSITDCPHSTPKWTESGKIVIRNQYIKNGRLDLSDPYYTDEENFLFRCKRAKPFYGDIIITREAPMGEVCMIPDNLECCLGQRMVLLKPNAKKCDNRFLLYALMSKQVQHQISWSNGTGTTVSNLRIPHLKELMIPDYSLGDQQKISRVLGNLDDKITLNCQINDYLEQTAQAIFKNWFVDFGPFADGGFVESELGEIPVGWRVGLLSELITVKYGKDHKKLTDGTIPVFGSGGIMRFVDTALYSGESILIPRKGTLNNVIYVNQPFWSVDTMFFTAMNRPNIAKFIYFFICSKDLVSMNAGSAVPSMTTEILNALPIVIPPDSVLARYEEVVDAQFRQIQANQAESDNLDSIRDTLLPRLMSGELSVADIQAAK